MKKSRKILSVILAFIIIIISTIFIAQSVSATEFYTLEDIRNILSCNYDVSNLTANGDIVFNSEGNKLVSKSSDTNNKALYYENGIFGVSSEKTSYVGLFDIVYWCPCDNITMSNISLNVGEKKLFNPVCTDNYGNVSTDNPSSMWFSHEVVDRYDDIAGFYMSDRIEGNVAGIERMRMTNRITGATTTYDVIVNMSEDLEVVPVVQARSNWCWAACAEPVDGNTYEAYYDEFLTYGGMYPGGLKFSYYFSLY